MSNANDRRRDRRYPIQLKLRWRLASRERIVRDEGTGRTLDMSSGGLCFQTGRPLPVGENVELSVDWPVMLNESTPLQFFACGTIVRSAEKQTAVRMGQHEFRTRRMPTPVRDLPVSPSLAR